MVMAIDKSTWNKNVKVSQSTIDDIKKLGMTKALKLASKNAGASQGGLVKEYQEATRRLYGDRRFNAATGKSSAPAKMSPNAADYAASKSKSKSPNAVDRKTKTLSKPASKSNTKSNVIKGTLGAAGAIGVLALSKGKATGAASKMAPGLVKGISKSRIGKALIGKEPKMSPAMLAKAKAAAARKPKPYEAKVTIGPKGSFGKTTAQQAKSGKGTPSEYASKAGQKSARASIKAKRPITANKKK
jgi:hypothetical protein